ncbi:phage tail protein [Chelativorans sp. AA-79]|uniref:COG4223 family protein n=1 Tax=Chelativorans sp. AA-79 TaxID=3028735 RepID=UPI0023F71CE7|nr:phage tail protein [Chelativorans sp. AA-79]WEX09968.1 phage tail protein [Chelativorans sp. AA-79]
MAKTPRTRHSRTSREPMTIDLEAESIRQAREEEAAFGAAGERAEQPGGEPAVNQVAEEKAPSAAGSESDAAGETETAGGEPSGGADQETRVQSEDVAEELRYRQDETKAETGPAETPDKAARPVRGGGGFGGALAGGVLGALIALGLGGALLWTGVIPAMRQAAPDPAVQNLQQEVASLQGELSRLRENASAAPTAQALEQALAEPRQQISELRDTVAALQSAPPGESGAAVQRLEQQIAELEQRLASTAEAAGNGDTSALSQRLADLEGRIAPAAQAASTAQETSAANARRLDELAGQVSQLGEQVAEEDEGPRLALIVAASALRSAVERGEPFASELETYSALAPNAPELDPLRPYAQTGIPSEAELVGEVPQVASRIAASASDLPPDAGLVDRLMASARSAVTVRPVGEVEGDTPEAIAARMEAAVKRGDYAQALAEYEALPPDAKQAAGDFAEKLRARQAAEEVLDKALSSALKPA